MSKLDRAAHIGGSCGCGNPIGHTGECIPVMRALIAQQAQEIERLKSCLQPGTAQGERLRDAAGEEHSEVSVEDFYTGNPSSPVSFPDLTLLQMNAVRRLIALEKQSATLAEQERCAGIAIDMMGDADASYDIACSEIADKIRNFS